MILDAQNQFSPAQAITADAVGTNVIDLSQDRSIGNGEPMGVLFCVDVAADQTTGDEDYTFDVEYASDADKPRLVSSLDVGSLSLGRQPLQPRTRTFWWPGISLWCPFLRLCCRKVSAISGSGTT